MRKQQCLVNEEASTALACVASGQCYHSHVFTYSHLIGATTQLFPQGSELRGQD